MSVRFGVLLALLAVLPRFAAAERLLSVDRTQVEAGRPLTVTVVDSSQATLPDTLDARLELGERRVRITLTADGAQTGALRRYRFEWPSQMLGLTVLRLADNSSSRALLMAESSGRAAGEHPVARLSGADTTAEEETPEPALSFYDPMYFVVGANGGATARFQLSFKYRLFDREGSVVRMLPFLEGLHFGYTQTSLWDLSTRSAPFRDTSYRPAFFYQFAVPMASDSRHRLSWRTGLEHESNGREGVKSRSINTAFVEGDWRYGIGGGLSHIGITPKLWAYLEKSDNPDIQRYRGYSQLGLRAGRDDGWLARVTLRRGESGKGSTQVDLSYPLRQSIFSSVGAFVYLQYFDGEGETLLDYDRNEHTQFRIGFSIVR